MSNVDHLRYCINQSINPILGQKRFTLLKLPKITHFSAVKRLSPRREGIARILSISSNLGLRLKKKMVVLSSIL